MATNLAVDDVIRTTWVCSFGGQVSQNVRAYRIITVNVAPITDLQFITELAKVIGPILKGNMPSTARFEGIIGVLFDPILRPAVSTTQDSGLGGVASDAMSPQTAGLISLYGDAGGRRNRGRVYLAFPPETESGADGRPNALYTGGLDTLATFLRNPQTFTVGANSVVTRAVLKGTAPFWNTLITTTKVRTAWATQRRRSFVTKGDSNPFT